MPFFTLMTPQQIEGWCAGQRLDALTALKTRMFHFIKDCAGRRDRYKNEILTAGPVIEQLARDKAINLEELEAAATYNDALRDNLSSSRTERYLQLQCLRFVQDRQLSMETKIAQLTKKREANQAIVTSINIELEACVAEMMIVDESIDKKTALATLENTMTYSC